MGAIPLWDRVDDSSQSRTVMSAKLRSVRGPARFLLFPIVHVPMFSFIPQEGSGMPADYTKRQAL